MSNALFAAQQLGMSIRFDDPAAVCVGWREDQPANTVDGMGPWYWKEWLSDHPDLQAAVDAAVDAASRHWFGVL